MADPLLAGLLALRARAQTAEEARVLELLPAGLLRRAGLAKRDAAARELLALLAGATATERACAAERELRRYLATAAWAGDRARLGPPEGARPIRAALAHLALANGGRTLGWRTLLRALDGVVTNTASGDNEAA